jgi:4-hydroxythreonine-4-phosphate dehydrogenase
VERGQGLNLRGPRPAFFLCDTAMKKPRYTELPLIAITAGDPAGIGPEIVAKALRSPRVRAACRPVVIGDRRLFKTAALPGVFRMIDVAVPRYASLRPGRPSPKTGRASYEYIVRAVELVRNREAEAIVTAPVSKAAVNSSGIAFKGHTELLAELSGTDEFAMLMIAGKLRTVMVTRHIPVAETGRRLTTRSIVRTALLAERSLRGEFGMRQPKLAIAALNPHAGEGGLLGGQESFIIEPAVRMLRAGGISAEGPLPADSAWIKLKAGKFDLLVTMYHDQAMIGLKCLAPDRIVNVTAGLPFVRTSPGHGTGFDIAGKDIADPRPMIEAILCAARFARFRRSSQAGQKPDGRPA